MKGNSAKSENSDSKVVGLDVATTSNKNEASSATPSSNTLEKDELHVREITGRNPWTILLKNTIASLLVFVYYLISLETLVSCGITVGLTLYWYYQYKDNAPGEWSGGEMDWIVLGFAVVTPISVSISMAFQRRERALLEIMRIRSSTFQMYMSHAMWDWGSSGNGRGKTDMNWLSHTDKVLEHLIAIGDELSRFLTLPTTSRTRHRMLSVEREEVVRTLKVAYKLFDSLYTQRIVKLSELTEKLKLLGLHASEVSRIRQYELFIGEAVEGLRMIKMYRTPQALRAFGRIFSGILPPFYAPTFAQLAFDLNSLGIGILFAVVTPLCLTALFESIRVLEDPFVAHVTLDGIYVKEEFEVLHWQQLINARKALFPNAHEYSQISKPAIGATLEVVDMAYSAENSNGTVVGDSRIFNFATGQ